MSPLKCAPDPSDIKTIITTHKNTDFDAMASMVAAMMLYPEADPLIPKPLNPNVKAFLSLHKDVFPWIDQPAPDWRTSSV